MPPKEGFGDLEWKNRGFNGEIFTQQPFYALNAIKVKIMTAAYQRKNYAPVKIMSWASNDCYPSWKACSVYFILCY